MAVGVSCGGTGMKEALDLLEPLLKDAVDFVRQGGLIATAMVLMQQPESKVRTTCSVLDDLRADYRESHDTKLRSQLDLLRMKSSPLIHLQTAHRGLHLLTSRTSVLYGKSTAGRCGGPDSRLYATVGGILVQSTVAWYYIIGRLVSWAHVCAVVGGEQVALFRRRVAVMLGDKHEEVMCRMGAIMAAGLLDAGGRNVSLGLRSRSGYFRRTSVVGLAVFLQYWYW
jgi:hypothetical protein